MVPSVLTEWDPEDNELWHNEGGKRIAWRNLLISIFTLFLAFAVWTVWSLVVVYLPDAGFTYSDRQRFMLTALPPLAGATGRIVYSFTVPIFGGRLFNTFATATLLIPTVGLGLAVQNPETPFWVMAILATTAGLGGANFSSSMDHIAYFFPERTEGIALGLNAGIGNIGVSAAQLFVPIVITVGVFGAIGGSSVDNPSGTSMWLQNAGFVWVPFILVGTVASYFGLNDIASVDANVREQLVILERKHNWIMCWLYMGTFGSFLGYAVAFPLLMEIQFSHVEAIVFPPVIDAQWMTFDPIVLVFVGPLLGALARPPGGWLADAFGGARVTLWVFILQAVGISLAILATQQEFFWGFFGAFTILFLASGVGNGSTFKMIPVIFRRMYVEQLPERSPTERRKALKQAEMEAGSVLGFSGGVGAYGGFFIPQGFGISVGWALLVFFVFYLTCIVVTWYYYYRPNAEAPC